MFLKKTMLGQIGSELGSLKESNSFLSIQLEKVLTNFGCDDLERGLRNLKRRDRYRVGRIAQLQDRLKQAERNFDQQLILKQKCLDEVTLTISTLEDSSLVTIGRTRFLSNATRLCLSYPKKTECAMKFSN